MQQNWPTVPPPTFENVQKEVASFCGRLPFLALFHHPARNEMANDVIYFWVKFGPIPCDVVPFVYIFWTEQIIIISFARMSVLRQDNVFIIKFSLSPRKFFGAKLTETAKIIIIIIIVRNEIMSVLGLNSGYTVKYSPPPLRVPSIFALGNSLRQRAIFDCTSLVLS